ncbi:hypothetical protein BGZ95_009811 [Linnemannia exigua]|uniref:Uncharacterized protein n=1 Tax=Linnemannia exigua TaxID=604196 RepID=A0AAD4H7L3_9FUNG|nr:hypothetical protein BGZ95_009811 [Linnemannia exigua]
MENELPQVQAVRSVNKHNLDSVVESTPVPKIMHFDCYIGPTTKKGFMLWDNIRLVYSNALYVRHLDKIVPFMKGIDFMPLQPHRIAATPDVPQASQCIPSSEDDLSNDDESTDIKPPQAPQDYKIAAGSTDFAHIAVKAILGDANAQVQLRDMHKIGDNVEQDYEAARYRYLKAPSKETLLRNITFGNLYRLRFRIDFNHSTALGHWYQKRRIKKMPRGSATWGSCTSKGSWWRWSTRWRWIGNTSLPIKATPLLKAALAPCISMDSVFPKTIPKPWNGISLPPSKISL